MVGNNLKYVVWLRGSPKPLAWQSDGIATLFSPIILYDVSCYFVYFALTISRDWCIHIINIIFSQHHGEKRFLVAVNLACIILIQEICEFKSCNLSQFPTTCAAASISFTLVDIFVPISHYFSGSGTERWNPRS